jgi:glutaminase
VGVEPSSDAFNAIEFDPVTRRPYNPMVNAGAITVTGALYEAFGVIGVVNRQLGIGSFAPRLDAEGNSVRGVKAIKLLSDELGLHAFECMNSGSSFVGQLIR